MLLLHGDCLELMKTLPDKSVDLFVCDLPYGCLGPHKKGGGIPREGTDGAFGGCEWDVPLDLPQFWVQVKRLCKDDHTPVLMFCNVRFGFDLIQSNPDWFRYDLVWNKMSGVSFLLANKMPMRSHENIYVFAKKGATYYRKDIEDNFKKWSRNGKGADRTARQYGIHQENEGHREGGDGTRCVLSVVNVKKQTARNGHPTQKPDELYEWLIERYSKEGDTVLDPTAGSFASVFTAERLNRVGIGIEKDKGFYDKALTLHPTTNPPSAPPSAP